MANLRRRLCSRWRSPRGGGCCRKPCAPIIAAKENHRCIRSWPCLPFCWLQSWAFSPVPSCCRSPSCWRVWRSFGTRNGHFAPGSLGRDLCHVWKEHGDQLGNLVSSPRRPHLTVASTSGSNERRSKRPTASAALKGDKRLFDCHAAIVAERSCRSPKARTPGHTVGGSACAPVFALSGIGTNAP